MAARRWRACREDDPLPHTCRLWYNGQNAWIVADLLRQGSNPSHRPAVQQAPTCERVTCRSVNSRSSSATMNSIALAIYHGIHQGGGTGP